MIYVLWFDRPIGSQNPRGRAQFYVGYADDNRLAARIAQHERGQGAAITRAAVKAGVTLHLLALFEGDRSAERRVKAWKNTRAWLKTNISRALWINETAAPIVELGAAVKPDTRKSNQPERIVS